MLQDLRTSIPTRVFDRLYYSSVDALIASLDEKIIRPAEQRFVELLARKAATKKASMFRSGTAGARQPRSRTSGPTSFRLPPKRKFSRCPQTVRSRRQRTADSILKDFLSFDDDVP